MASTVQPSTAQGLAYKCFARQFQPGAPPVLYLMASGYHGTGGYQLFFQANGGFSWTLMENVPGEAPQLLTWYVAGTTTSQPVLDVPAAVQVTDGHGTSQVPVEPWISASADVQQAPFASPGMVRLATGEQLGYKVFGRPYDVSGGPVLFLLATCSYPTGQWDIFFNGAGNLQWDLLERVPGMVNMLITYYEATTTTFYGLIDYPAAIYIRDAFGTHPVEVQAWFLDAGKSDQAAPPGPRLTV